MQAKERQIYTIDLAILGNFNPVIVNPYWLASKKLIRESEIRDPEVIHPSISKFELDWVSVDVSPERFDLKSKRESDFELVRDLATSIFTILKETPIKAFGINHLCHYTLRDAKEYEDFGYWLSPVQKFSRVLNVPKLFSITYNEEVASDDYGRFKVTIAPSDILLDKKSIVFNINHHMDMKNNLNAKEFLSLISKAWEKSFEKTDEIIKGIWEQILN